jgi:hypothetical protein
MNLLTLISSLYLEKLVIKLDCCHKTFHISVMSSINVTNTEQNNNIAPITIQIMNSLKNEELFNKTHYMMNCYKYSLYVPLLLFTLKYIISGISSSTLASLYNSSLQRCHYIYSNIIGPSSEIIQNLHFMVTPKAKEIVFNCISNGSDINIIYSFNKGVIANKKRFEDSLYQAYDELISIPLPSTVS